MKEERINVESSSFKEVLHHLNEMVKCRIFLVKAAGH